MEELRLKQEEIAKKDCDIKVVEAIIRTLKNKRRLQRKIVILRC
jgi:hypothetical protein